MELWLILLPTPMMLPPIMLGGSESSNACVATSWASVGAPEESVETAPAPVAPAPGFCCPEPLLLGGAPFAPVAEPPEPLLPKTVLTACPRAWPKPGAEDCPPDCAP